jgi:hypothetical protein
LDPVTIFDLLFILLFLLVLAALTVAGTRAMRGRRREAFKIIRAVVLAGAAYFVVLIVVSLATPQRFLPIGVDRCSDDWCIAVTNVERTPSSAGTTYNVAFRISSRARRVTQRERGVVVYLRDQSGYRYEPQPDPAAVPFDTQLAPLEAINATRRFVLPSEVHNVGLVVSRSGVPFPGCCIIGGEGSLLHRRTIVSLE